jgi:hypothetical protein
MALEMVVILAVLGLLEHGVETGSGTTNLQPRSTIRARHRHTIPIAQNAALDRALRLRRRREDGETRVSSYTKTLEVPHGIVFLCDPEMDIDIPEDVGSAPVISTSNCVSIWTLHEIDGAVEVTITDEKLPTNLPLRYQGLLIISNNRLSYNNSSLEEIVGINVSHNKLQISIFSDDEFRPEKLVCFVET